MLPLLRRSVAALLLGLAAVTPTLPAPAMAAGGTGLAVTVRPSDATGNLLPGPGYFRITATPGSVTQLYALVGNPTHQTGRISIVPVDAATGVYGGVTAMLASQPKRHVARWVHLSVHKVTLRSDRGEVVPFTVTVPRRTRPGQYVGALTASTPSHDTVRSRHVAITVQTRLADFIVITVPGKHRRGFRLRGVGTQIRTTSTYLLAYVHNAGNVMLHGWGYLWVWQPGRRHPILSVPLHIDNTLPGTTVKYPIHLGRRPRPGRYGWVLKVWWHGGTIRRHGEVTIR